jgi:murein L,D-transpeptidase YcbB/YkuD
VLKVGTQGHYMHRVKNQMFRKITGHFPHATTGAHFNKHFRQAVRHFQARHGLQVDGIIGKQTLAAIRGNRHAARIAPGSLTAGDRRWLREGDQPADAPQSAEDVADLIVERLDAGDAANV